MRTNKNLGVHILGIGMQVFQLLVVYHSQPFLAQTLHLGAVVHYVAKAVELSLCRKMLFGGANGIDHTETETSIIVNKDLHR